MGRFTVFNLTTHATRRAIFVFRVIFFHHEDCVARTNGQSKRALTLSVFLRYGEKRTLIHDITPSLPMA